MVTIDVQFGSVERLVRQVAVADRTIEDMGVFMPAVGQTVEFFRARGSEVSPFLTGALSEAHEGRVEVESALILGVVDIDPDAINSKFGGRPAVYGEALHRRNPWLGHVMSMYGERQLGLLSREIESVVVEVFT